MNTPAMGSMASTEGGAGGGQPRRPGAQAAELSAGTIGYQDTGGSGPVTVLLHGLMMDASLWDGVAAELAADYRCVAPTLPSGAHRHAMKAGADPSLPGTARLVTELLDRLDLREVTLVGNDTRADASTVASR
jgi:pimeloyl-ACP methyl ester carboxylesterase